MDKARVSLTVEQVEKLLKGESLVIRLRETELELKLKSTAQESVLNQYDAFVKRFNDIIQRAKSNDNKK